MNIAVLTSSRADYGIYLTLLDELKKDPFFNLEIIAFGTHLSKKHGLTISDIVKDGYDTIHKINSLVEDDSEKGIAISYGKTVLNFSDFWTVYKFDLVFCLGDRFEMSAAVQAGIPFGVKFAHIHGGETTLGAIDNIYRDQITSASYLHFTSTNTYKEKVTRLIQKGNNVFNVGSLSLSNISDFQPIEREILLNDFNIPNEEYALVTFHPETINPENNYDYVNQMSLALIEISKTINIVITLPNADTFGSVFREEIIKLVNILPNRIFLVENFGKKNYFSAMLFSKILIGNTSSGILEAASFGKYVINVGDRQKGRLQSKNIYNVTFNYLEISSTFDIAISKGKFIGENIYYKKGTVKKIIKHLLKEIN